LNFWNYSDSFEIFKVEGLNLKVKMFKSKSEMTKLPLVPLVIPPVVEPDWAGPN
jgi:hypothetical protein